MYIPRIFTGEARAQAQFHSYRLSHVLRTMKALQTSNKTSLRIDAEGVMGLQFLTTSLSPKTGAPVENFVEFRVRKITIPPPTNAANLVTLVSLH